MDIEEIWKISKEKYKIQQIKEEWLWLLSHIKEGSDILEVGCYDGGSTFSLANFANSLITVDMHNPARFNVQDIKRICHKYAYIPGDSHSETIFNRFAGYSADFIFLDGDHTYEGVKKDFEIYSKYIRPKGLIAFHDIRASASHAAQNCFVSKFWNEIKTQFQHDEYLYGNEEWGGIGILQYG